MPLSTPPILFLGSKKGSSLILGPSLKFSSYVFRSQQNVYQHALTQFAPYRAWVENSAWDPSQASVEQYPALRTGRRNGTNNGILFMVGDTYANRPLLALDPQDEYRMDAAEGDKGYEIRLRFTRMFYYNTPGMSGEHEGWETLPENTPIYSYYLMRLFDIAGNNYIAIRATHRVDNKVSLLLEVTQGNQVIRSTPILVDMSGNFLHTAIIRYSGSSFSISFPDQDVETSLSELIPYSDPEANIEFFDSDVEIDNYMPGHVNVEFLEIYKLVQA